MSTNTPTAATGTPGAAAPDPNAVPLDDEAKALKLAQAKAEARKAIAEADKATLAAKLPTTAAGAQHEGAVDMGEKVGLVGDLLAHGLLEPAATRIRTAIAEMLGPNAVVLITEDRSIVAVDWNYEVVSRERDQADAALEQALELLRSAEKESPHEVATMLAPALLALPAVLGAASTIVGLLRSDYAIRGRDVSIGTTPLVAAVSHELVDGGYAKVVVNGFQLLSDSRTMTDFWGSVDKRNTLEREKLLFANEKVLPAEHEIASLAKELDVKAAAYGSTMAAIEAGRPAEVPRFDDLHEKIKQLQDSIRELETGVAPNRGVVAVADAVLARFDAFAASAMTPAAAGAFPPLVTAAIQERLRNAPGGEPPGVTHILFVAAEAAGGEAITRHGGFKKTGTVGFIGGVQVSHLLLDVQLNALVSSGTEPLLAHLKYDLDTGDARDAKQVALNLGE